MIINIILTINPKLSAAQNPTPFLSSPYYGSYDVSQRYSAGHSGIDFLLAFNPVLAAAEGWQEVAEWDEPSCHDDEQPFCGSAAGLAVCRREPKKGLIIAKMV